MDAPKRTTLAAAGWTAVAGLAIARTLAGIEYLTVWAIVLGQISLLFTGWILMQDMMERQQQEMFRFVKKRQAELLDSATQLAVTYNMDAEKVARAVAHVVAKDLREVERIH